MHTCVRGDHRDGMPEFGEVGRIRNHLADPEPENASNDSCRCRLLPQHLGGDLCLGMLALTYVTIDNC